ncbi:MAG: hypothetical protein M0Q91_11875 [Methanoregula sp.]|jgi:hypothetical protein|nr:hypothetical protein [Methanoregula sp.]
MKFTQITQTAGDCTAGFAIDLDREYTVGELINEILTRHEWGYIGIHNEGQAWFQHGTPNCEYRKDKLVTEMQKEVLTMKIKSVTASGGYSRMDYIIYLQ